MLISFKVSLADVQRMKVFQGASDSEIFNNFFPEKKMELNRRCKKCLFFSIFAAFLLRFTWTFAVETAKTAPERKARRRRSPEGPAISVENQGRLRSLPKLSKSEALKVVKEVIQDPSTLRRVKEVQSFMTTFGKLEFWRETLELLDLKRTGEWPVGDIVLTNTALSVCSQVGNWELVLGLLDDAPKHSVSPDIISYNLAMAACCNSRQWEIVLQLLDDLQEVKGRKDFSTFNVTVHACMQGGKWESGIAHLNQMLTMELQPTWTMYNLGILLAGEGERWETALHYLQDMWSRVVMPDAMTYTSVVSVCERANQWEQAVALVHSMKRKGFPIAEGLLSTLSSAVRACEKAGEASFARKAFPEIGADV